MPVSNVLAQVEAICKNISGVGASSGQGLAETVPLARAPVCYVEPQGPAMSRLTGGEAGVVETRYTVLITLVLGGPELPQKRALELAKPFFERFRTAFWADPTIGGTCWKSELQAAATNLRGYRNNKTLPSVRWRLVVWELGTAEGNAATLVPGARSFIAIGEPGNETDISAACSSISYDDGAAEHDATPYGATAETTVPGLERGIVTLAGKWDPTTNALLAALRRVPGRSIVLGPAGNGTGKPRISAPGYLRDYAVQSDAAGGPVSWRALFRASGGFTFDTF